VLKLSTVEHYRQRLRVHLIPTFGHMKVRMLHRGGVKAFLAEKLASGLAPDSVRLILATLRALLNAAVDDGVIMANPAARLGKALRLARSKATRQEQIKAMDGEQLSRFLGATLEKAPQLYPLFVTLARAGLRLGEALGLKWTDLDLVGRTIRVERAISNAGVISTPKSGHGRDVDMSLALRDVLQRQEVRLKARALEHGRSLPEWCFPSEAGTPMDHTNVAKAFKRVLRVAGLPLHHSPHDLRVAPAPEWRVHPVRPADAWPRKHHAHGRHLWEVASDGEQGGGGPPRRSRR
jgi:integrase